MAQAWHRGLRRARKLWSWSQTPLNPARGLLLELRGAWSSEAPGAVLTPGGCLGPPAPAGGPASVLTTHVHLGCGGRDLAATYMQLCHPNDMPARNPGGNRGQLGNSCQRLIQVLSWAQLFSNTGLQRQTESTAYARQGREAIYMLNRPNDGLSQCSREQNAEIFR